jgi:hypothetical protein
MEMIANILLGRAKIGETRKVLETEPSIARGGDLPIEGSPF